MDQHTASSAALAGSEADAVLGKAGKEKKKEEEKDEGEYKGC